MVVFPCLLVAVLIHSPVTVNSGVASIPPYQLAYALQYVDHFNYLHNQQYLQRCFYTDKYWSNDSNVLFFYTGNEGSIESFYNNSGFVFELAEKFSALVVFAEHRYYGDSLPFDSDSFSKENIGYLTADQALADFAVLIKKLKVIYKNIEKVIAFGGSYGGMLSAWLRFKYPNVVDGALAASAPIYMVAGLTESTAFFEKVTEDFNNVDKQCPVIVREAFSTIINLSKKGSSGLSQITKEMKLCKPLTADKVDHLMGWARNSFTILAMLDYPYPTSFIASLPANPVKTACDILLANADTPLAGLADSAGLLVNGSNGTLKCYDIEKEFIECADPTGCGLGNDALAWDYQACTQMVLKCETNNITDMFPPKKYDVKEYCKNKWGVGHRIEPDNWMDTYYWGQNISSATNIIFSNGNLDPWSVGGVMKDAGSDEREIYPLLVEGGAHHLDLRSSNSEDPQSVIDVRKKESDIIAKWISQ